MSEPKMTISAAVLGTPDPRGLGAFYSRLLSWPITFEEDEWVMIKPPEGGTGLSFQLESDYKRPAWPEKPGAQQMMVHLDIAVDDVASAAAWATEAGATAADFQPQDENRVMLDPAGHPFCLFKREG